MLLTNGSSVTDSDDSLDSIPSDGMMGTACARASNCVDADVFWLINCLLELNLFLRAKYMYKIFYPFFFLLPNEKIYLKLKDIFFS